MRQPVMYISHGGGPCFWIDTSEMFGANAFDDLRHFFEGLLKKLPEKPKAILMVTAHWEEAVPTISTAKAPGMLYDYYGFPEHTYHLKYLAMGAPDIAAKTLTLLKGAGIDAGTNDARGFDHGVFVPMLIIDPKAKIPVVMMSLKKNLDPAQHIAIGKALAPLRDDSVLIIGSGSSYHSLREWFSKTNDQGSIAFDTWLNEQITTKAPSDRNDNLINWKQAPSALSSHPREEHLLPLMVVSGAAEEDIGRRALATIVGGKALSCFRFGS